MVDLNSDNGLEIEAARRQARRAGHVQHAQTMLLAAGLCAFAIVAAAGAMMATLF